jgi:hypothetical protein
MIDHARFRGIADQACDAVRRMSPHASGYLEPTEHGEDYLARRILTAVRGDRRLQFSIDETILATDAFFKSTGLEGSDRLLQVTCPVNRVNFEKLGLVFIDWIVDLRSEPWIVAQHREWF